MDILPTAQNLCKDTMGKEYGCVEETVKHGTHDRNQEINYVPQQFNMYTKSLWSVGGGVRIEPKSLILNEKIHQQMLQD